MYFWAANVCTFILPQTNGAILKTELKYNEETKEFEGKIVIKDYIRNGEMYLYEIEAMN